MAEPTFEELKQQIRDAVAEYWVGRDIDPAAAMLSGMALTANFMAKLDGSKTITAAVILRAVTEIGKEEGIKIERL